MSTLGQCQPLFILGNARSGTTLFQALLDGHPQLLVDVADSHFFDWMEISRWNRQRTKQHLAERILIHFIFNKASPYYQDFLRNVPIGEVEREFEFCLKATRFDSKSVLEAYFHAIGKASGKLTEDTRWWVAKVLGHQHHYQKLVNWWPLAKFIFVCRDPRDMYSSFKMRDINNNRQVTPPDALAYTWNRSARQIRRFRTSLGAQRMMVVRYEDLVNDRQRECMRVRSFLDVVDDSCLQMPTKGFGAVPWKGNPADRGRRREGLWSTEIQKWRSQLTFDELELIESLLSTGMSEQGYVLETTGSKSVQFFKLKNLLRELRDRLPFWYSTPKRLQGVLES